MTSIPQLPAFPAHRRLHSRHVQSVVIRHREEEAATSDGAAAAAAAAETRGEAAEASKLRPLAAPEDRVRGFVAPEDRVRGFVAPEDRVLGFVAAAASMRRRDITPQRLRSTLAPEASSRVLPSPEQPEAARSHENESHDGSENVDEEEEEEEEGGYSPEWITTTTVKRRSLTKSKETTDKSGLGNLSDLSQALEDTLNDEETRLPPIKAEDRRQPNLTQTYVADRRLERTRRQRPPHPRCLPSTTPLSMLHKPSILPVPNHTTIVKSRFGEDDCRWGLHSPTKPNYPMTREIFHLGKQKTAIVWTTSKCNPFASQSKLNLAEDWREGGEFLPKVFLVGNYGNSITKEHLSRQPLFVSSLEDGATGSRRTLDDISDEDEEEDDDDDDDDEFCADETSTSTGLLRNHTVAKAFQILMDAKPVHQTECESKLVGSMMRRNHPLAVNANSFPNKTNCQHPLYTGY